MINDKYKDRSFIIGIVIACFILLFIGRLAQLQLIEDYSDVADNNAFYRKIVYAQRGLIYDRNGKLLVYNQPTYDLMVTMNELNAASRKGEPIDTLQLCALLDITPEYFLERMEYIKNRNKNYGYSPLIPQRFITQLSSAEYALLQEQLRKYPGFSVQSRTMRNYKYPYAAHALGQIGEVGRATLDKDPSYTMGDYIGVVGFERAYEEQLRGKNGVEILLRDARGRIQGKYQDGESDIISEAGHDMTTTLDIDLQAVAEELLQGKIGSVVAIEPSTGEILAIASSPTWNPELLVGRARRTYYPIISQDKTKPFLNRATQGTYSPGSTFKIIQALVALQMKGIKTTDVFGCNGKNSTPIRCTHSHGSPVTLENAIKESCNPYFWSVYKNTLERDGYGEGNETFKTTYDEWRNYMLEFGFGPKLADTDILEQSHGGIPTINTYTKWYGKRGWRALTIRSNAIGQGEVEVTPLQLANSVAVIANRGYYITPHINRNDSMLHRKHTVNIDDKYFDPIFEGMWRVCNGKTYNVPELDMCGKTGTTDNSTGSKPHSMFFCFAPRENPQIAIAVVVENAGFGSQWAAPIASLCIEQYINGEITRTQLYERIKNTVLNPDVKKF